MIKVILAQEQLGLKAKISMCIVFLRYTIVRD